jgi:hypothetical protein
MLTLYKSLVFCIRHKVFDFILRRVYSDINYVITFVKRKQKTSMNTISKNHN